MSPHSYPYINTTSVRLIWSFGIEALSTRANFLVWMTFKWYLHDLANYTDVKPARVTLSFLVIDHLGRIHSLYYWCRLLSLTGIKKGKPLNNNFHIFPCTTDSVLYHRQMLHRKGWSDIYLCSPLCTSRFSFYIAVLRSTRPYGHRCLYLLILNCLWPVI